MSSEQRLSAVPGRTNRASSRFRSRVRPASRRDECFHVATAPTPATVLATSRSSRRTAPDDRITTTVTRGTPKAAAGQVDLTLSRTAAAVLRRCFPSHYVPGSVSTNAEVAKFADPTATGAGSAAFVRQVPK